MTDKKVNRIASASLFAALLLVFLLPMKEGGRIIAAILLLLSAVLIPFFVKKRPILSIYKKQVLVIITVIALLYVMLFYLSGIEFGYLKNPYRIAYDNNFWRFFLPIAVIIVSTETVRYVLMAQKDFLTGALCYVSCIIADMLICSNIPSVNSFNVFMDLVAGTLFPALLSNMLFNYLTKRYGMYPNIVFRLLTVLHAYTFTVTSGVDEAIVNLVKLFLPIIIYLFIDALYEKKVRYALKRVSRVWKIISIILTAVIIIIMVGTVMLVSNQFKYGSLVIATESMTGELNKGDIVLFERYENQVIDEGRVIVFESGGSLIVHRVVDIEIINGVARYYTKGDANEDLDMGYITDADIVGVTSLKLPYFGYPTLWMRSLFKR